MSMCELEKAPLPPPDGITVTYVSPGGVACRPFAEGYLTMRVCLGHIHHPDDGLEAEMEYGREPVPWISAATRNDAIAELRRRAKKAEGDNRSKLIRLLEHVRQTPYYEVSL